MKQLNKLVLSALAVPVVWLLSLKLFFLLPISIPPDLKWFVSGIIGTLLALFITRRISKLNNVSLDNIGLNWESKTPQRLLVGLLIGLAIASLMLFTIVQYTALEVNPYDKANVSKAVLLMLAIIPLAFMEEVVFRGFMFFKLREVIGLRSTLIITSILFAYYHDLSGATFFTQLLGPGIWGVIYGIAAIWSRGLAVPTGIHIGANTMLGVLGLSHENYAIWMTEYPAEVTEAMQSHTESVGILVQLVLLFFGVLATEWYIRSKGK